MIFFNIFYITTLSATIDRRDYTIVLSRIILVSLAITLLAIFNVTHLIHLKKGLSLYNGIFQCNTNTQIFNSFILLLAFIILSLSSFYPRKIRLEIEKLNGYSSDNTDSIIDPMEDLKDMKRMENNDYVQNKQDVKDMENIEYIKNMEHVKNSQNEVAFDEEDENIYMVEDKTKEYRFDMTSNQFKILEYSLLILFILSGAIFLMSANDIISIFIAIELQSYGLYLLSTVYRNSESSTKAGLTYFLLGGLSSCIILLSQGLLYINSGITNLENIYILSNINILNLEGIESSTSILNDINNLDKSYILYYTNVSLAILSVGLLFKVSAAPFHFWSPDVYDGVPTIVTTFIAIIAKISIFILLLDLVHFTSNSSSELLTYNWNNNLLLSSLFSLLIGTILGLTQSRIKRLYAYSTISHVGFILLALSINTTESIQAFIFYLLQYSISNLNAFIILLSVGYLSINYYKESSKEKSEIKEANNSPIQLTSQLKGLYIYNPLMALSFAITLFSFLGVPPLLGFFGKQMVLSASLDKGYIFMSLVAILTSVISAVYYLVVIKQIFFDENEHNKVDLVGNLEKKNTYKSLSANEVMGDSNEVISVNSETKGEVNHTDTAIENETKYVYLSSNLSITISILTLITSTYIFVPGQILKLVKITSLFTCNV